MTNANSIKGPETLEVLWRFSY